MKNDQIKINTDSATVIAEVVVSLLARTITIRICQLSSTGEFMVLRNDFSQGTFAQKDLAVAAFLAIIEDEAV
jgi:hypothetical protein